MNTEQVKTFCQSLPGAEERNVGAPNNVLFYLVGDKKFAYFKTSEPEQWRFSVRVTADRFLELTDQPNIKPARYMHRFRWISIVGVHGIDDAYLQELITWSYQKALSSLSKKRQAKINAEVT